MPILLLLLAGCEQPCEEYAEEQFWADLKSTYCERKDRCDFPGSCGQTADYLDYQREELAECGATYNACQGKELVDAAASSCESPTGPSLYGEVYTPECPQDTGR
jgi:hypothetical protein